MILKEEKIVFVHINKCAGSSVEVFFNEYPRDQHWTMKEYESKIKNWDDIDYVFTIVRNPWDRLFSWFAWCNRDELWYNWNQAHVQIYHQKEYLWGMHGGHPKVNSDWYEKFRKPFKKFIQSIETANDTHAFPVYKESSWNKGRWVANQTDWLKDSEEYMDVDKILKFENLDEDFKNMLEDIKPKFSEKRQKIFNKELPQAKVLRHKPHYSLFYDDDSIDLVSKLYADDIKTFDYSFEDKRPRTVRSSKRRTVRKK